MSPYLFALAMEYVGGEMKAMAENSDFNYHPKCWKLGSTYIYFADDLLMYCRADLLSVQMMTIAFLRFSGASGLQVNLDKCSLSILLGLQRTQKGKFWKSWGS